MLNKVFAEEREFAAAYAPIVRKCIVKKEAQAEATPVKQEVQIFDEDTEEFAHALRQISPEILDLLKGQFNARVTTLLRGAFKDEVETTSIADEADTSSQFTEDSEEEDDTED